MHQLMQKVKERFSKYRLVIILSFWVVIIILSAIGGWILREYQFQSIILFFAGAAVLLMARKKPARSSWPPYIIAGVILGTTLNYSITVEFLLAHQSILQ